MKSIIFFLALSLSFSTTVVAEPAAWEAVWLLRPNGQIVHPWLSFPLGQWNSQKLNGDRFSAGRVIVYLMVVNDAVILISSNSAPPSRVEYTELRPSIELSFSNWQPFNNQALVTYKPDGTLLVNVFLVQKTNKFKENNYVSPDLQQMRRKVYSLGMVSLMWQMPIGEN